MQVKCRGTAEPILRTLLVMVVLHAGPAVGQVVPTGPAETLESAWQAALQSDQRLESSAWGLSAANSSWAAARAERMPSFALGANYIALSEQPSFAANFPPLPAQQLPFWEQQSVGLHGLVNQPLYTSGRITHGIDAAAFGVQANRADVARAELDVKINVAEIYVTVLRAVRMVEVAASKVASLTEHNRVVADHFDKGIVSKNDHLAAQVALADAQQQLLEAQNGLEVSKAAYNRALGRPLDAPVQLAELQDDAVPCDVNVLTQSALQLRPEIAGLSAQACALREQAESVQAKSGPQVGVQGGYVYQQNRFVDPNGVAVLALGVEWNAFDFGRIRNQAESFREKAEAVIRIRKDVESMITLEVRQKWLDQETARQRVAVARQATTQADENLRVARDRYEQQAGTNTEVLDAETLRVQAFTNLYNSTYQAVLTGLRLHRAVGDL